MKISVQEVEYVAKLARLELDQAEKEQFTEQLSAILTYMDKLDELDTGNVAPTTHVVPLSNVFRSDEPRPSWPVDQVMANAPDDEDGYFRVPAVLE